MKFLKYNIDITHLSRFRTQAKAAYYFEIASEDDLRSLIEVVKFWNKNNLPVLFIGSGTNMLFAFDTYDWIVIRNNLKWWTYDTQTQLLHSYSKELISDIAQTLKEEYNQNIWQRFIGLPWSIWGAVFGNAGCFWLETAHNFLQAKVIDIQSGQLSTLSTIDMNFSYRTSVLKEKEGKYFLIATVFDLSKKVEKYSSDVDNIYYRKYKQPKWNTCGSFFKNPSKENSAGKLIEGVWLKWYQIWGAYFSDIHANFLMNEWGTYKNILDLIELAQNKVKSKFDIDLINEVRIITNTKKWIE